MQKVHKSIVILEGALKLFSQKGFFATTMPDIAKFLGMSSGNIYNYFRSKEELAKSIVEYCANLLADEIKIINETSQNSQEKIERFVGVYFDLVNDKPEFVNYFLRVNLANHEIFSQNEDKLLFDSRLIREIRILFEDGVLRGELRNQDFFCALGLMIGHMAGVSFMSLQGLLENNIEFYKTSVSKNIYEALRLKDFEER